mmetsp:Transcript_24376/g.55646  ORF Transcript_24376/g.55646 Transcript_24376/m.55646 type:complete len:84 (-) Transcript_24376:278-529(-)
MAFDRFENNSLWTTGTPRDDDGKVIPKTDLGAPLFHLTTKAATGAIVVIVVVINEKTTTTAVAWTSTRDKSGRRDVLKEKEEE